MYKVILLKNKISTVSCVGQYSDKHTEVIFVKITNTVASCLALSLFKQINHLTWKTILNHIMKMSIYSINTIVFCFVLNYKNEISAS